MHVFLHQSFVYVERRASVIRCCFPTYILDECGFFALWRNGFFFFSICLGHFIAVEAESNTELDLGSGHGAEPPTEIAGILISPVLEQEEWSCLRLVYQITESGSLEVLRRSEGDSFDKPLWSSQTPSESWVISSVDLQNTTEPYRVKRLWEDIICDNK